MNYDEYQRPCYVCAKSTTASGAPAICAPCARHVRRMPKTEINCAPPKPEVTAEARDGWSDT
jgi:hypothetical protein